MDYIVVYK